MSATTCESKQSAVSKTLQRCPLFAGMPLEDIRRLAAITVVKPLAKGDYLFHEGSPVHGFYLVRSGAVKVHRVNSLGREQVIHVFRAGESFAEDSLMSSSGHPADACATEPSQVLLIQKAGLLEMLKREPDLVMCLLRSMSRHLQILIGLLDDLKLKDVKTRFALWLLHQCPDPGSRQPVVIQLPSTKRVLAAELGAASETLSRTVAKFRDQKLLAVDGNTVTLFSPFQLNRLFAAQPVSPSVN